MSTPHHYVEPPDIPEGMTCREYRASKSVASPPRRRFARLPRLPRLRGRSRRA